ncbi:unnamed protein product, partial [Ectocarpus sp. 13 AM-2016]
AAADHVPRRADAQAGVGGVGVGALGAVRHGGAFPRDDDAAAATTGGGRNGDDVDIGIGIGNSGDGRRARDGGEEGNSGVGGRRGELRQRSARQQRWRRRWGGWVVEGLGPAET